MIPLNRSAFFQASAKINELCGINQDILVFFRKKQCCSLQNLGEMQDHSTQGKESPGVGVFT